MAKATKSNGRPAPPKIQYAAAQGVSRGLSKLSEMLPLPLNAALRVARIQRETAEVAESHQNEARKREVATAKQLKTVREESPEYAEVRFQADLEFAEEGKRTVAIKAGWVKWDEIETAVETWRRSQDGKEAKERQAEPEGLGNIIALILPVLDGAPEEVD